MSVTAQQSDASVPTAEPHIEPFVDWDSVSDSDEPSEEKLRKAREETLDLGNRTEIHYDSDEYRDAKIRTKKDYYRSNKYHRLDQHNRDNIWRWRTDADVQESQDFQYKRHTVLALGSQLGLSELERQKAFERIFALDLQQMGVRTDLVAFCVCALVSNEDPTERYEDGERIYHPQRSDENNPDAFVRVQDHLIEAHGTITRSAIQSVFQKIAQDTPSSEGVKQWDKFIEETAVTDRRPSYNRDGTKAPAEHPNNGS